MCCRSALYHASCSYLLFDVRWRNTFCRVKAAGTIPCVCKRDDETKNRVTACNLYMGKVDDTYLLEWVGLVPSTSQHVLDPAFGCLPGLLERHAAQAWANIPTALVRAPCH